MLHFAHDPGSPVERENPHAAARRARYGMILFLMYLALYAGFMLLNVFDPSLMETTPLGGLNLAIVYGFGLIAAALVSALFYAWLCRQPPWPEEATAHDALRGDEEGGD
ncbi:MAG: DUF485 domain-containing protein [Planctomycetaceae bacterium]